MTVIILVLSPASITGLNKNSGFLEQWGKRMFPSTETPKIAGFILLNDESNQSLLGAALRFLSIAPTGNPDYQFVNYKEWTFKKIRLLVMIINITFLLILFYMIFCHQKSNDKFTEKHTELLFFTAFFPLILIMSPLSWITHYVYLFFPLIIICFEIMMYRNRIHSFILILIVPGTLILICPNLLNFSRILSRFLALSSRIQGCFILWGTVLFLFTRHKFCHRIAIVILAVSVVFSAILIIFPGEFQKYITVSTAEEIPSKKGISSTGAAVILRPDENVKIIGSFKNDTIKLLPGIKHSDLEPLTVKNNEIDFRNGSGRNFLFKGFGRFVDQYGIQCINEELVVIFFNDKRFNEMKFLFSAPISISNVGQKPVIELIQHIYFDQKNIKPELVHEQETNKLVITLNRFKLNAGIPVHMIRIYFNNNHRPLYLEKIKFSELPSTIDTGQE
ncbi:MAG: hypothetical protein A2161_03280 [Candidatus Schekmanbacteria bacterium RBG_13_48_7]|uniref:Uncharacterized protein n=1 Tax=Candidatus Schekmanbacteria bacterium RBG_13_48_7 TaxID=1817878 RepID=A0A1F7RX49_9BACT|nr:MAG: hypothetical protein A2161_03280 [Candidatus Schekmanbacteria bacterium RBG_13_48_7]